MILSTVFDRFVEESPVTLMLRAALEYALPADEIDALFERHAKTQYTRELLFSSVVDLMSLVVCRVRPSVHNAYQANKEQIGVSLKALYEKLNHTETAVCSALVGEVSSKLHDVLDELGGGLPPLLPGYRVRILDGNHLAKTDRRLKELRAQCPGPLPGQALVVFDPQWCLATDVICCEDAHTQERALLGQVLSMVDRKDVWLADRNFCTPNFLFGIARRKAYFAIRQHKALKWERVGKARFCGRTDTGRVWEQTAHVYNQQGEILVVRRITLKLDKPIRDGETELHILTNLPRQVAALTIAGLYRQRWQIETAFGEMENILGAEISTLAYPKAALLAFSVGLLAYNVLSVIQGALRAVHGVAKVQEEVSVRNIAEEARMTYRGMVIAIDEKHWGVFAKLEPAAMATILKDLARRVRLQNYRKHRRGPKKPAQKDQGKGKPHVATARLLKERKNAKT